MISLKAQYALRALLLLAKAQPGAACQIADIAESQKIPKKFLEQILLDLKNRGILMSRRGKAGGYLLLRPADRITFGEVLRIIDGPLAPLPCLSRIAYRPCEGCEDEKTCNIRRVFGQVTEATRQILDTVTLADALADPARIPLAAAS